ncbi:MAG: hypothetical protein LBU81_02630 [Methanosarcinales archaeon]|jgi:cytochrome c556|nr:hypothetical protein [Methanosarcinales archaeon]
MTDPKAYAGVYAGKTWMGNMISIYKEDGTCFSVIFMGGQFVISNTGKHQADGDKLTVSVKPLMGSGKENEIEMKLFIGQKITYSDKYGSYELSLMQKEIPPVFNNPPQSSEPPADWIIELRKFVTVIMTDPPADPEGGRKRQDDWEERQRKAEEERKKADAEKLQAEAPPDENGGTLSDYCYYFLALNKEVYTEALDESGYKVKGDVFAFLGFTNKGEVKVFPAVLEEHSSAAAWTRMFEALKPLVYGIVHFTLDNNYYDDAAVKPPLETVFPNAKYYKKYYTIPYGLPYKMEFGQAAPKFIEAFNAFWDENRVIADIPALKTLADGLQSYLEEKL